jgi:formate dehydrogenase subunit gamma
MTTSTTTGDVHGRIADIIAPLAQLEGPALPMLHAIQDEFGYVPEAAILALAHTLNITRAEMHGIVSFYHDFRRQPAGRTVVKLCRAEACQAMGADRLAAHACRRLGISWHETTPDGAVTLEPVFCLGLCSAAPAAMVNASSVARLDQERLDQLLESVR